MNKLKEYKELSAMIKQLTKQRDTLKESILQEMDQKHTDTIKRGGIVATLKTINQMRLDSKAVKNNNPAIYRLYSKPSQYNRLEVK